MAAHDDFRAHEAAAGVLDHGKGFGEDLVHGRSQFRVVLDGGEAGLPVGGLLTQGIIGERLKRSLDLIHLGDERAKPFDLAVVLGPDDFFYEPTQHDFLTNSSSNVREEGGGVKGFRGWRTSCKATALP